MRLLHDRGARLSHAHQVSNTSLPLSGSATSASLVATATAVSAALSWAVFAMCCGLFVVLVVAFTSSLLATIPWRVTAAATAVSSNKATLSPLARPSLRMPSNRNVLTGGRSATGVSGGSDHSSGLSRTPVYFNPMLARSVGHAKGGSSMGGGHGGGAAAAGDASGVTGADDNTDVDSVSASARAGGGGGRARVGTAHGDGRTAWRPALSPSAAALAMHGRSRKESRTGLERVVTRR